MMNIYKQAAKVRLRFKVPAGTGLSGQIMVEDLWRADLKALDMMHKTLKKEAGMDEDSLLPAEGRKTDSTLQLKMDIIKDIVTTRLQDAADKEAANDRKDKREKLLAQLAVIEERELGQKSREEIMAELAKIDG